MTNASELRTVVPEGLSRWRQSMVSLQGPALVALAYYLGAQAAFYIGTLSDQIFALFWPPNVILFCALVAVPQRRWWLYIAAVFPAHVIAEHGVGMPIPQMLVAFATNCMVALLNAYAVRRFVGDPPWFGSFQKACIYIVITAGISPGVSAFGGAFVPILGGGALADYWTFYAHWFLANALPSLTLGPVFLHLVLRRRQVVGVVAIAPPYRAPGHDDRSDGDLRRGRLWRQYACTFAVPAGLAAPALADRLVVDGAFWRKRRKRSHPHRHGFHDVAHVARRRRSAGR